MKHVLGKKLNYAKLLWARNHPITGPEFESWFGKLGDARRKKLRILFEKQNGICIYCEKPARLPVDKPKTLQGDHATVEHIIPWSKGGTDSMKNLCMSCKSCNNRRGTIDHEKFMKMKKNGSVSVTKADVVYEPIGDLLNIAKQELFGPIMLHPKRAKRAAKPEEVAKRNSMILYNAMAMMRSPVYTELARVILGTPNLTQKKPRRKKQNKAPWARKQQ